jgi:hypothetical protein
MKFVLNTAIKSADATAAITDVPPSRSLNENRKRVMRRRNELWRGELARRHG